MVEIAQGNLRYIEAFCLLLALSGYPIKNIFEQTNLSSITLKNRIIRSATHEGLADEKGYPTGELKNKYILLAKGEAGAIITGYAGIQQNGKSPLPKMLMIDSNYSGACHL